MQIVAVMKWHEASVLMHIASRAEWLKASLHLMVWINVTQPLSDVDSAGDSMLSNLSIVGKYSRELRNQPPIAPLQLLFVQSQHAQTDELLRDRTCGRILDFRSLWAFPVLIDR